MKKLILLLFLLPVLLFGIETSYNLKNATGYYTLGQNDAISTAIFDRSGSKNNGTSATSPVFTYDQNNTPNSAQIYNGTSDKVTFGNVGNIKTFGIWIYPTANTRSIADFDGGTISIEIDGSNDITATGWTAPTIYVGGLVGTAITLNDWNYISVTSATAVNATALVIGNEATWFAGNLSDHIVYSDEKSADFIYSQYLAGQTTAGIVEDGTDLLSGWDFTSGWNIVTGTIDDFDSFTTTGAGGLLSVAEILTANRTYRLRFAGTTTATRIDVQTAGAGAQILATVSGTFDTTVEVLFLGANGNLKLYLRHSDAGTSDITIFELTDITNQRVATLSQNLGFDMPMTPKITKSGATKDSGTLTIDRKYVITAQDGEDFTADGSPDNNVGTIFVATGTNVTLDANDTVKEIDAVTLDLSNNANHGIVSGATVQYDGLVNAGAGIAYIPSTVAKGVWEFNLNKGADANALAVHFMTNDTNQRYNTEGYVLVMSAGEAIFLFDGMDGGTPLFQTVNSYITINTDYRIRIERTDDGTFTVKIMGGAFGWNDWTIVSTAGGSGSNPVLDNTYTTSSYFVNDLDNGDSISDLYINGKPIQLSDATQSTGTWTTTKPSYYYDGTDVITIPSSYNSTFVGDFSISYWLKPDDGQPASAIYLFGDYVDVTGRQYLRLNTDGTILFRFDGNSDIETLSTDSAVFPNGSTDFTHITIAGDQSAAEFKIYVNGVLEPTTVGNSITSANWALYNSTTDKYYFGDHDNATGNYLGYGTHPRIWGSFQSATEALQEHNRLKSHYQ